MLPTALRSASSLARRARQLSSSAASLQSPTPTSLWRGVPNVDASRCFDPLVSEEDLQVLTDVLTEEEELVVADECMKILKRRRYEENHWDSVIVKFKEMERSRWSPGASCAPCRPTRAEARRGLTAVHRGRPQRRLASSRGCARRPSCPKVSSTSQPCTSSSCTRRAILARTSTPSRSVGASICVREGFMVGL
jgi:hypothetical protein